MPKENLAENFIIFLHQRGISQRPNPDFPSQLNKWHVDMVQLTNSGNKNNIYRRQHKSKIENISVSAE
uniref:Uncharacterized protein n=1 Tax=Rhizophora mucronata TaxID=61149 RepID=A0A2P2MZL6_RHIMU